MRDLGSSRPPRLRDVTLRPDLTLLIQELLLLPDLGSEAALCDPRRICAETNMSLNLSKRGNTSEPALSGLIVGMDLRGQSDLLKLLEALMEGLSIILGDLIDTDGHGGEDQIFGDCPKPL